MSEQKINYWVTMTDKFMSGWGKARGTINKLVITCETREQAQTVEQNAGYRSEMKHINICITKPRYSDNTHFVSWHGKEQGDYKNWFIPLYFYKPRSS